MHDDPLGTLGEMMDALGRAANAALKHIVVMAEAALPLLLPPKDLRLTMGDASTVTGILLVENNRIVAGLVIHHSASPGSVVTPPPRDPSPSYTKRGRFDEDDDEDCRLPGWADGGHRGSPPWGR